MSILTTVWQHAIVRAIAALFAGLLITLPLTGCEQLDRLKKLREGETTKTVKTTVPPEMQADANSSTPVISANGRFVAFRSDATNLVIGTNSGASDIYVKDLQTGATIRVSTSSEGALGNKDSTNPAISADGRFVAFESTSSNLVPGDANQCTVSSGVSVNCIDVFIKDRETGATKLVSASTAGEQGNQASNGPSISADGALVAFMSSSPNLVPGDANGKIDIFVKDTRSGALQRVSTDGAGAEADNGSANASISADGRWVAFSSEASNLVPDDTNGKPDVFIKDRQSNAVIRVSTGAGGEQADDASGAQGVAASADGRYVAFESAATNLVPGDTNGKRDVYVKDIQTGAITRASVDAAGGEGQEDSHFSISISGDGRWVAFRSESPNLVPGDTNVKPDVFLKDIQGGTLTRMSTDSAGAQGKNESEFISISADGRLVVFDSASPNLVASDTNNKRDIFLKDTRSGATTRVSTSTSDVL